MRNISFALTTAQVRAGTKLSRLLSPGHGKEEPPVIFPVDEVPADHLAITDDEVLKLAELPRAVRAEKFQKWRRNDKCPREGCGKLIGNHALKKFKEHFHVATFGQPVEDRARVVLEEREREAEEARETAQLQSLKFPERILTADIAKLSGLDRIFGCRVRKVREEGAPPTIELVGQVGEKIVVTARYEQHGKHEADGGDWYLTRKNDQAHKNHALIRYRAARSESLAGAYKAPTDTNK